MAGIGATSANGRSPAQRPRPFTCTLMENSPGNPLPLTATGRTVQFDPRRPVPTIGGNISSGGEILLQGGWDQRGGPHVWNAPEPIPLSARNDVLVFQTEPLAEDVEVTGPLVVKLWVSSSAVDTDFTAKLIDVPTRPAPITPGGFDLNTSATGLRTRFRESLKAEVLTVQPGVSYPLTPAQSFTRHPTSLSEAIASAWTSNRAAIFPGSISIPTRASRFQRQSAAQDRGQHRLSRFRARRPQIILPNRADQFAAVARARPKLNCKPMRRRCRRGRASIDKTPGNRLRPTIEAANGSGQRCTIACGDKPVAVACHLPFRQEVQSSSSPTVSDKASFVSRF